MVAILDHHQDHGPFCFARQTFGIFRGHDAIEPAIHDEKRTGDVLSYALKRKCLGILPRFVLRLAVTAHAKGLAREFRQPVPCLSPIERPTKGDASLDALVKSRRSRSIVPA